MGAPQRGELGHISGAGGPACSPDNHRDWQAQGPPLRYLTIKSTKSRGRSGPRLDLFSRPCRDYRYMTIPTTSGLVTFLPKVLPMCDNRTNFASHLLLTQPQLRYNLGKQKMAREICP